MDWNGIWYFLAEIWGNLIALLTSQARITPIWVIFIIMGCFTLEGIRHFVKISILRRHVRKYEQAETERRLGIVEKPAWERKRNKEIKIDGMTYHPVQRDPGGIWLHIADTTDDAQSRVLGVSDVQKLIHNSVEFHSGQHKGEANIEAILGVVFIISGALVYGAYHILNIIN